MYNVDILSTGTAPVYPAAALFSISSSTPIMEMNTALGFEAVGYDQLPAGSSFWEGCKGCVKHNILVQNDFKHCLCTAMLFTQAENAAGNRICQTKSSYQSLPNRCI